ncbi:MAG: hypothetical protein JSR77_09905 [Planctomycetes bacterium]|nr:hypothetical protein [Planctomycetota bacterium]
MTSEQIIQLVLWGVATPLLAGFVVFLTVWWRRSESPATVVLQTALSGALGVAGAYVFSQGMMLGVPSVPAKEAAHWLPIAALAGAGLGVIELLVPRLANKYVALAVVIGIGVVLPRTLPLEGRAEWLRPAVLLWSLLWASLRVVCAVPTRFVGIIAMGILSACAAALLAASGSLKLGQLAGIVAFALLGSCLASVVRPGTRWVGPASGAVAALLASMLGQGIAFGSTPQSATMVLAGAAVAAMPASTLGVIKASSWKRVVLVGAVVAFIGGVAVAMAAKAAAASSEY